MTQGNTQPSPDESPYTRRLNWADFEAVLFDMDGVITDTEELHRQAEVAICRQNGLDVPLENWESFKGRTADDIFATILKGWGNGRALCIPDLISDKTKIYSGLASCGLPLVPGAMEFLAAVRQHFDKMALATSSNAAVQRLAFEQHGLQRFFDAVTTGDELSHGKPHPEAYLTAAAKLGVAPERCIVIEDSDNGVRAGVAAGCTVIGITTSFPAERLAQAGAHLIGSNYAELAERLGL
ncbi:MAG: HAD family phosphatase [Patescibacteria group bacterium]|nr:HAD family phosphatase [Patescibacteria group bacterium]